MEVKIRSIEYMDGEFKDFIGVWENFLPKDFCVKIINKIEELFANALIYSPKDDEEGSKTSYGVLDGKTQFPDTNVGRKDQSLFLNGISNDIVNDVNTFLYSCLNHYQNEYGQLKNIPLISWDVKAQKTESSGGYHHWHYENSSYSSSPRELAWIIYLNDIDEGEGETEFLYQKRRITPTSGTIVIWPAGLTHVHRGNPVYTRNKYILTGWFLKGPML